MLAKCSLLTLPLEMYVCVCVREREDTVQRSPLRPFKCTDSDHSYIHTFFACITNDRRKEFCREK